MPDASKRLAYLEKIAGQAGAEPMALYALAMEYRSLTRLEEALATFTKLRDAFPDYLAQYLMCGQLLEQMQRPEDARHWYEAGVALAGQKRDAHAASELTAALQALG